MSRGKKKKRRDGFYLHFASDSDIDNALDQWCDFALKRGINISGYIKTLWYESTTGRNAVTGEPLVKMVPAAASEAPERRPAATSDPKALRLIGMED